MVRWWAVFFIVGVFSPCDPILCFIPIFIIAMDQCRGKPLIYLLFFPSLIEKYGDHSLQTARMRDFILISATGIIVMSAAGTSFIVSVSENQSSRIEKDRERSISADKNRSYTSNLIHRCGKIAERPIAAVSSHFHKHINDPGIDIRTRQILRALLMAERDGIDDELYASSKYYAADAFITSELHVPAKGNERNNIILRTHRICGNRQISAFPFKGRFSLCFF